MLQASSADADPKALRFSLHGLRGAAGNLALTGVSQLAGTLEERIRGGDVDGVLLQLPYLQALLEATLERAQAIRRPPATIPEKATPDLDAPGPAELRAAIDTLLAVLARHELDDRALDTVRSGLMAQGHLDHAQALDKALDAFDFEQAATLLKTLSDQPC